MLSPLKDLTTQGGPLIIKQVKSNSEVGSVPGLGVGQSIVPIV